MHIFFSGIGGTAIGPLALIAHQAGYTVSGSDKQDSQYIQYLRTHGIESITIGQTEQAINQVHQDQPIDWYVYSSSVAIENPNHPELKFVKTQNIKASKRDELLNKIINDSGQRLVAIAGTHGKTTTTAMMIWLFKQMNIPVSYSVGAKVPFGEMGHFDPESRYFVYECDEFDRNFLAFNPYISLITGIDYDHHEIFPTRQDYQDAFKQFISQSECSVLWQSDIDAVGLAVSPGDIVIADEDQDLQRIHIPGHVNRRNGFQVARGFNAIHPTDDAILFEKLDQFPGLSRRFEKIAENLYTDYAHTVPKIAGCLQLAKELSKDVVVVYEPLTNRRQHYIKEDYAHLFTDIKQLYWVPSYLAREDPDQEILSPEQLIQNMHNRDIAQPANLDAELKQKIQEHLDQGDLVVCLSGGGGNSLDEWLRKEFK